MMTDDKNKNIDGLLSRFYDKAQAGQIKNDIESGDKLLASFPAPAPSAELVDDIKARISAKLARRPRKVYYRIAAAVALIIIIINLLPSTRLSETTLTMTIDTVLDDSSIFSQTDADLALLSAEFEQIEMSILALKLGETENGDSRITDPIDDLETKLIEIETVFWKG